MPTRNRSVRGCSSARFCDMTLLALAQRDTVRIGASAVRWVRWPSGAICWPHVSMANPQRAHTQVLHDQGPVVCGAITPRAWQPAGDTQLEAGYTASCRASGHHAAPGVCRPITGVSVAHILIEHERSCTTRPLVDVPPAPTSRLLRQSSPDISGQTHRAALLRESPAAAGCAAVLSRAARATSIMQRPKHARRRYTHDTRQSRRRTHRPDGRLGRIHAIGRGPPTTMLSDPAA